MVEKHTQEKVNIWCFFKWNPVPMETKGELGDYSAANRNNLWSLILSKFGMLSWLFNVNIIIPTPGVNV